MSSDKVETRAENVIFGPGGDACMYKGEIFIFSHNWHIIPLVVYRGSNEASI